MVLQRTRKWVQVEKDEEQRAQSAMTQESQGRVGAATAWVQQEDILKIIEVGIPDHSAK